MQLLECGAVLERIRSEKHPVLYNIEITDPMSSDDMWMCDLSRRETLEDSCDFMDSSAERHTTPLCSVSLWWAVPSAPPVTQFHSHSALPDPSSISAPLPQHLCLTRANGIRKRTVFAEEPLHIHSCYRGNEPCVHVFWPQWVEITWLQSFLVLALKYKIEQMECDLCLDSHIEIHATPALL